MQGIRIVMKKELDRVFRDRKAIVSIFVFPILSMILIGGMIHFMTKSKMEELKAHTSLVYVYEMPKSFPMEEIQSSAPIKFQEIAQKEVDDIKRKILNGEGEFLIEFSPNFEEAVSFYAEGHPLPFINTYENPSEEYSREVSGKMMEWIEIYRERLLEQREGKKERFSIFSVNPENPEQFLVNKEKAGGKIAGTMLPYFVTVFLFAGILGLGADVIAGEKERGTLSSLLVSPISRVSIVLGKILSLMIISATNAFLYIVTLVIGGVFLLKKMKGVAELKLHLGMEQILLLLFLLLAISFLYTSVISLLSAFAKTVKEAAGYIMPAYMLVLLTGLSTMFSSKSIDSKMWYLPFYNSAIGLQGILSKEITPFQYGITLLETLCLGGIFVYLTVKAFQSEKIMAR